MKSYLHSANFRLLPASEAPHAKAFYPPHSANTSASRSLGLKTPLIESPFSLGSPCPLPPTQLPRPQTAIPTRTAFLIPPCCLFSSKPPRWPPPLFLSFPIICAPLMHSLSNCSSKDTHSPPGRHPVDPRCLRECVLLIEFMGFYPKTQVNN